MLARPGSGPAGLPPEFVDAELTARVVQATERPWGNLTSATQRLAATVTQDRSFHRGGGCRLVREVLERTGLGRIVVGHTPGDDARRPSRIVGSEFAMALKTTRR